MNMSAPDIAASKLYTESVVRPWRARAAASTSPARNLLAVVEALADFITCTGGFAFICSMCALHTQGATPQQSPQSIVAAGAALGLIAVLLAQREGGYSKDAGLLRIRETERVLRVSCQALGLLTVLIWLLGAGLPLQTTLVATLIIPALLIAEKHILFSIAERPRRRDSLERAVVYGSGELGRRVASTLSHSFRRGLRPVAVIDNGACHGSDHILEMGYRGRSSIPMFSEPVTAARLKSLGCDWLLLAEPSLSIEGVEGAINAARQVGAEVAILREPMLQDELWPETIDIDGVSFAARKPRRTRCLYEWAKRITDAAVASALLAVLSPALIAIAIAVQLDSPGGPLFVQRRIGRDGSPFSMLKFRSMYADAPQYARSPVTSSDPRITRVGRILRRLSLDELPQLVNVLAGNMSLVGPRPEMPFVVRQYNARQWQRLQVTPGITGLWQLSADRAFPIHENIAYDLYYIRNRSFSMDAAIMIHTIVFALCGGI
jgi:exopolysaccharide biosynthesis polyprenyl glycosylphosphotransferase